MAAIDSLPGDQRAVLQLVLGRGRSYDEIARLLSIDPGAVRARARAATDALGPPTQVPEANRQMICDYLLGQLPAHEIPAVRDLLADSAPERGWARALSPELAPLSVGPLPEIPSSIGTLAAPSPAEPPLQPGPAAGSSSTPQVASVDPAPAPAPEPDPATLADAADGAPAQSASRRRGRRRDRGSGSPKPARPTRAQRRAAAGADEAEKVRSSRRGGIVVIAVSVIVVAAVIVVVARHHHSPAVAPSAHVTPTNPASATQTSSSTPATSAAANPAGAKVVTQINLSPAGAGSKAVGIADVLQAGSEREVAIVAQNVPANTKHNSYEVWLYDSQSSAVKVGFVVPGVTTNGKLSVAGPLPADASRYRELIITTETVAKPTAPGPILLSGAISGL